LLIAFERNSFGFNMDLTMSSPDKVRINFFERNSFLGFHMEFDQGCPRSPSYRA